MDEVHIQFQIVAVTSIFLLCILFARQLNHPSIITFYGTNLQHGGNGTKVMIVLELCSCSLRSHVMSYPENAPARLYTSSEAVKKKVLGWALNILDALRYINSKQFVHRDLKLDKILVSWWNDDSRINIIGIFKHLS